MDEIHYIELDADRLWDDMITAYVQAGGDILYPGDEKEMLLRGVQAIVLQALAGADAALRMDTLRYASGDYLDLYGEKCGCTRIPARRAQCTVEIKFSASGTAATIPAGAALTADGDRIYQLLHPVNQTALQQTITAEIISRDAGIAGNGLKRGTQMQMMTPNMAIISIFTTRDASGGQDAEDDDTYRDRIRTFGLSSLTTGPEIQYESAAKAVSSRILDAHAMQVSPGTVGVYLIFDGADGTQAIIEQVQAALNDKSARPLTDRVQVQAAKEKAYTLNVQYTAQSGSDITQQVGAAISAYQAWQDNVIGQPFNPDRLMAMIYQAGATRVTWGPGSAFDGGAVAYKDIAQDTRCKGVISIAQRD